MSVQSKRTTMKLYSNDECPYSHRVKLILAEKGVLAEVINIDLEEKQEELYELNPYGQIPTLMSRDLIVYESDIIFEYLEERFPHPPLLSVFPIERARIRILSKQIDQEWMPYLVTALHSKNEEQVHAAKTKLVMILLSLIPMFKKYSFFMSDEYSIVDCSMAVILYRLPQLGIQLPQRAKPLIDYAQRLLERPAFIESLEM